MLISLIAVLLFLLLLPFCLLLATGLYVRFRRDLEARYAALAVSDIAVTAAGPIEYAQTGRGPPVLFVHGAGGGFDQGLEIGAEIAAAGFRLIAMSRFGYLRTPMPADASPQAQADAHAALLDALQLERAAIIGGSAGAPSAMQFALRHRERCRALVIVVPLAYAPKGGMKTPRLTPLTEKLLMFLVGSDLAYWVALKLVRPLLIRLVLGTDPRLLRHASLEERQRLAGILAHILPIRPRLAGILNDARVSSALPRYALEAIEVPTLVVGLRDDGYGTYAGAAYCAQNIRSAQFLGFDEGGHLWLGHQAELMEAITKFVKSAAA